MNEEHGSPHWIDSLNPQSLHTTTMHRSSFLKYLGCAAVTPMVLTACDLTGGNEDDDSKQNLRVDRIADLRSLSPDAGRDVVVRGYKTPNDGGGGIFNWDPSGRATNADGGTTITSTVSGYGEGGADEGLWRRLTDGGPYNARWFGATADGTDDQLAIQSALDAVPTGGVVFIPTGTYVIGDTIEISSGTTLRGDGFGTLLKRKAETNLTGYDVEEIKFGTHQIHPLVTTRQGDGGTEEVVIRGLQIQGNTSSTSGPRTEAGIWVNDASNTRIVDCKVEDFRDDLSQSAINDFYRAFCVCVTDSTRTTIQGGIYNTAGYEVIGVRGGSKRTRIRGIVSTNVGNANSRHTIQASDFPAPVDTVVSGCTLDGDKSRVIADNAVDFVVTRCMIRNEESSPVEVLTRGGSDATDTEGTTTENVVIDGNELRALSGIGIKVRSLDQGEVVTGKDLTISDNLIESAGQGLLLTDIENASITGNQIDSLEANGIRVRDDISSATRRVVIANNIIRSNDTSNANGEGAGVSIGTARRIDVRGIHLSYGRIGVLVEGGADSCLIANNDLVDAAEEGLRIDENATNITRRNNRT